MVFVTGDNDEIIDNFYSIFKFKKIGKFNMFYYIFVLYLYCFFIFMK